jgi:hypothetical protein
MAGLFNFLVTLIVLCAAGAMFFIVVDKAAPDATMNRVAKIAVGTVFAVVIILAIRDLLFGGGVAALSVGGIISFAIGIIVILVVLYLLDIVIGFIASMIGAQLAAVVKVIVFAIILIALLVLVDSTLMGGRYTGAYLGHMGDSPSIMKPEHR